MSSVVCLGVSVLDYIVVLDDFPTPDSKQVAREQIVCAGGNSANTAVALARLGLPVRFVSKVGPDAPGAQVRAALEKEGLDCESVFVGDPGERTVTCFVTVSGATRTIISMPYPQRVRDLSPDDLSTSLLDGAALLELDGRHPLAARRAAEWALDRGVPILVEAEARSGGGAGAEASRAQLGSLLELADYVVTSERYPCLSTGEALVEDGLRQLLREQAPRARLAVATLGGQGCVAIVRDGGGGVREVRAPAHLLPPDDMVDSTGAGDAFIGGLAFAIVRGDSTEEALALACWVGARCCTGLGGSAGLPRAQDLAVLGCAPHRA